MDRRGGVDGEVAWAGRDSEGWGVRSARERAELLHSVAQRIRECRADLMGIALAEAGKVLLESDPEVSEAIDFCEFYAQSAEAIAEMTVLAATEVARFGLKPKAALLSHSSFGSRDSESSLKMRKALALIRDSHPELMVEGEMQANLALSPEAMAEQFPNSNLTGVANLLVMPNLDAAHIAMNLIKSGADGIPIGPILLGCDISANIVTPGTTVRGLVNMTAIAAARCATESK